MYMDESGLDNPQGLAENALKMYLDAHLARQFHQPDLSVNLPRPRLRNIVQSVSHKTQIERARASIQKPERHVLVLGSQTIVNRGLQQTERISRAHTNID